MSYAKKTEFLAEYRKLCERTKCFIDTGYGKPLYVMTIMYPVDSSFEKSFRKLEEDVGQYYANTKKINLYPSNWRVF